MERVNQYAQIWKHKDKQLYPISLSSIKNASMISNKMLLIVADRLFNQK